MNESEHRISLVKVTVLTVLILGGGYLAVARWRALHPPIGAPRVVGPRYDLAWPVRHL